MSGAHSAGRHHRAYSASVDEGTVLTVRLGSLGREPALALIGVVGPLVGLLIALAPGLSHTWQVGLQSLGYATAGLLTAGAVASDKLAPAIMGFAQALLNVGLAAGLRLDDQQQAAVMSAVSLLVAAFVRTQVTAPLPDETAELEPEPTLGQPDPDQYYN